MGFHRLETFSGCFYSISAELHFLPLTFANSTLFPIAVYTFKQGNQNNNSLIFVNCICVFHSLSMP